MTARSSCALLLGLLAAPTAMLILPVASARCEEEKNILFEERFDEKPGEGWAWIARKDESWRIKDGGLEFRVGGKDNVLARQVPDASDGPFAVEVTLTSLPQPTRQYEQGGFAWFFDGKQAFKYVKERIDGKTYVFLGKKEMSAQTVQLRIEVRGDKFTALFRPQAKGEYQTAFAGDVPNRGKGKQFVALMAYNGPGDAEHWLRFDDFRIVRLAK